MAHLIDKSALVAEITQRIEDYKSYKIDDSYHDGLIFALEDLRDDFINTLEVKEMKEEPVNEDLANAVNAYIGHKPDVDESSSVYGKRQAFKAGAKWQKEQFEKERLKHCDALTKEQAQMESDFVTKHLKENNHTPTFIDAIEYGMKLQKLKSKDYEQRTTN